MAIQDTATQAMLEMKELAGAISKHAEYTEFEKTQLQLLISISTSLTAILGAIGMAAEKANL